MDFKSNSDTELWSILENSSGEERGRILIELGFRSLNKRDFNKAISFSQPAVELFKELKIKDQESIANYVYGSASRAQGELNHSITALKSACEGFREVGLENLLGLACYELANAHIELGKFNEAEDSFVSSLNILTAVGDNFGVTQAGSEYGEFLGRQGLQARALEIFTQTKEFAKNLDDPLKVAYIEDRIAACLIELARGSEALDHLKTALDIVSYAGSQNQIAWALYRYGWTLQTFEYSHQALKILEESKKIFDELGDVRQKAKCDFQIAHVLHSLDEFEEADILYSQLKEVFSSFGDLESHYLCEVNRGNNLSKTGDKATAINIYKTLISSIPEGHFEYIKRYARTELAHCLNSEEFYKEALEQVEAIDISEYADNRLARLGYLNVWARTLALNNRIDDAEFALKEILSTELCKGLETTYAQALETLSMIAHIKGNDVEMLDLRGKAISYYLAGADVNNARKLADNFAFAPSNSLSKLKEITQTPSGFKFGFTP